MAQQKPALLVFGLIPPSGSFSWLHNLQQHYSLHTVPVAYPQQLVYPGMQAFSTVHYCYRYRSARQLLSRIKPAAILYNELDSYTEVLVNLTAQQLGIPTAFVDHGLMDEHVSNTTARQPAFAPAPVTRIRQLLSTQSLRAIRHRMFIRRSRKQLPPASRQAYDAYAAVRSQNSVHNTRLAYTGPANKPDALIAFSQHNLDFYRRVFGEHIPQVFLTGFPEFDDYFTSPPPTHRHEGRLLFIDQPHVRGQHYGWTLERKRDFLIGLEQVCTQQGLALHIYTHPGEQASFWQQLPPGTFQHVISTRLSPAQLKAYRYIAGYNSTLLLPLVAQPGTVFFALHNHPHTSYQTASFFSQRGLGIAVHTLHELAQLLQPASRTQLVQQANAQKASHLEPILHLTDGRAEARMHAAIHALAQRQSAT